MRRLWNRIVLAVALGATGTILLSGPGTGCLEYAGESLFDTIDFCFVFDCQNGLFGGAIDPCPNVSNFTGEAVFRPPSGPLFVDCPNAP